MKQEDDQEQFLAGEERIRIPEGLYEAKCIDAKMAHVGIEIGKRSFSRIRKVILTFQILKDLHEDDQYQGIEILMYLNADYKIFPPGSKFYQSWVIANNCKKPNRKDRMSLNVFTDQLFLVDVVTVAGRNSEYLDDQEVFSYSRVDRILRKMTTKILFRS